MEIEHRTGSPFREWVRQVFPFKNGEPKQQHLWRLGRETGIGEDRFHKLAYDEKCEMKVMEYKLIQQRLEILNRISKARQDVQQIRQHGEGLENEEYTNISKLLGGQTAQKHGTSHA